jgi:hypothetical protein
VVSPVVITALDFSKLGRTIPLAAITSPDMNVLWMSIDYPELQQKKTYTKVKKRIDGILKGEIAAEPDRDAMIWWKAKGAIKGWLGRFVELDEKGRLVIKRKDGHLAKFTPDRLDPVALAYAKFLAGQSADPGENGAASQAPAAPVEEDWESNDGKTIRATFVSLAGGKITLRKSNGKQFTFSLSRLSEKSQARVRELAGQ